VKLALVRYGHSAAYHGVRLPAYAVMTVWWALIGVISTVGRLLAWWHVPDLTRLERQAAADGLLSDHLRIHKAGRDVRTTRGFILAAGAARWWARSGSCRSPGVGVGGGGRGRAPHAGPCR
jgi:hypothetical protein